MKAALFVIVAAISLLMAGQSVFAAGYERRDVRFTCQGLSCAGWYYVPDGLSAGEKRPAIVMAHGFSAVKEMLLDNFASKFADAGFVVLVFDYRFFGESEGEPRGRLLWPEQIQDYRDAITWVSLRGEVDPNRIGVWGTSYSGGHVMFLAAYDRRIKAVVSQVPVSDVWDTYFDAMPVEQRNGFLGWLASNRADAVANGNVNYITVAAPEDQPSVWPLQEWYDAFMRLSRDAPSWKNGITVESLETHITYEPAAPIHRISPTPLLMIVASDDVITPTQASVSDFEKAGEPKKLIVVPGRHFDAYEGPDHPAFAGPAVEWFETWLMPQEAP
jgi:acetyl esterase/lipase